MDVTLREYIWLNDRPIAVAAGVNTATPAGYFVITDHLGRPARMVDSNGFWAWDVIYSPFGGAAWINDATAKLDMRFPGQWFQMENGLAYNWHRHYDATLGRYVQPDPIGYAGGRSLYGYVGQNPLVYTDPDGLDYLSCMSSCTSKLDPLNAYEKGGLDVAGGTFPKSWIGRPRGMGSASRFTTIPSALGHLTGGGGAGTLGAAMRGLGRFCSPAWVIQGNYTNAVWGYCAASCASEW